MHNFVIIYNYDSHVSFVQYINIEPKEHSLFPLWYQRKGWALRMNILAAFGGVDHNLCVLVQMLEI